MSQMLLHCGGRNVSFDELAAVPLPEETETYTPVAFQDIVTNAKQVADDLLKDYSYVDSTYALAGKDQRMFAIHTYRGEDDEMGHSIGIRSSYDKSMSNGICSGAKIFVCDNLIFRGEITYMRKHTKNVIQDLEDKLVSVIYNSTAKFQNIIRDRDAMTTVDVTDNQAYEFLGKMAGNKVLRSQQFNAALRCWKKPPYEEFAPKNVWSLYNACTEALKSTPPNKIIEKHIMLHDYVNKAIA